MTTHRRSNGAPHSRRSAAAAVEGIVVALAVVAATLTAIPALASEESRLEDQVARLERALAASQDEKDDMMRRAWDPYFEEYWGNTPEARQQTQTSFDGTRDGGELREQVAAAGRHVEEARAALAAVETSAGAPSVPDDRVKTLQARIILLQARLEGDNAIIEYQKDLREYVKEEVTGWADTWIKEPFSAFARDIVAPFCRKMVSEVESEIGSRAADFVANDFDPQKLNPGIGAGKGAKGVSKLLKMAIKSGMDVEMRLLFARRLNELAAAKGYDPMPDAVATYWFDHYVLAKAESSLLLDDETQKKGFDKLLKAFCKRSLTEEGTRWASSEAGREMERRFSEEFAETWKNAMIEARRGLAGRTASDADKERILATVRERLKAQLDARKETYSGEMRKKLTETFKKRIDEFTRDPEKLSDGLSILDNADFAVNDIGVPLITVWMNGAQFETIVDGELDRYHILDEFVKRKTNSRMNLALFRRWYPEYERIVRYRNEWDLTVRAESLEVPPSPETPFRVTLHYSVKGISAVSEMKIHWELSGPGDVGTDFDARVAFADEYEIESGRVQPARWDWLLTNREVPRAGLYTVAVTVEPNYAPLGDNPIAGPRLRGWTVERSFVFGSLTSNADSSGTVGVPAGDGPGDPSAWDAATDSSGAEADSAAAASSAADSAAAASSAADSASAADAPPEVASGDGEDDLESLLDAIDDSLGLGLDASALRAEWEEALADLEATADRFETARRFFSQRLNEGREVACGSLGLAFAYAQAERLLDDYARRLADFDNITALRLAGATRGAASPGGVTDIEARQAAATAQHAIMELMLRGQMADDLNTFGCDENDLALAAGQVADPDADPDQVGLGGYAGGTGGDGPDGPGVPGPVPELFDIEYPATVPSPGGTITLRFRFQDSEADIQQWYFHSSGQTPNGPLERNDSGYVAGDPVMSPMSGAASGICEYYIPYFGLQDGNWIHGDFWVTDARGNASNHILFTTTIRGK